MKKRNSNVFIVLLVISYIIVGYLKANFGVAIDWVEDVTLIQKLNEYYVRNFWSTITISI